MAHKKESITNMSCGHETGRNANGNGDELTTTTNALKWGKFVAQLHLIRDSRGRIRRNGDEDVHDEP